MKKSFLKKGHRSKTVSLFMFLLISVTSLAQNTSSITGKIVEEKSKQPIPYVTVSLTEISNAASLPTGTASNDDGIFTINRIPNGTYKLQISSIGYKTITQTIETRTAQTVDLGCICLQDSSLFIAETVIIAERIKGKTEADKSIYYINNKMLSASGSAPELLRHVPGVQVDLKQNITLDGNSDILLFVDGKEHDKSYINQLAPSQIDKIEVLNTPPSNYNGNVSGVINLVLKREKASGLSGHIFSEIPTSTDVVYLFPTYNLNYSHNKINLYTSYNGEINFENIDETTIRKITGNTPFDIISVQTVRQKNLSHKFHYGIDYHLTPKDVFNFYGFYNHYSYEQDGDVVVHTTGNDDWKAQKEETDKNQNFFNSLYYKHRFNAEGKELTVDISNTHIRSENDVTYNSVSNHQTNNETPQQTTTTIKVDFTTPINDRLEICTGAKAKFQAMYDKTSDGFCFDEQVHALYGAINFKISKFDIKVGLRAENAKNKLNNNQSNSTLSLLPYTTFHYKANGHNDFSLSYRRSVNRPSVYLLNPYSYTNDPYTLREGNSALNPEFRSRLQLEYSTRFKTNYVSARLFYEKASDVINNLTSLNDNNIFVTQAQNLGDIHQYGVQLIGALKFGILSINPSLRLYNQSTFANSLAKKYGIENKENLVFESGISSILSLKKDFTLSATFQYATAKENIQDNAYCDALYVVSLDKTFKKKLKIGVVSALPFTQKFVYQGADINANNFTSTYKGNLKLPTMTLMFRVNYQFNVGKNRSTINREKENVDTKPKQGF